MPVNISSISKLESDCYKISYSNNFFDLVSEKEFERLKAPENSNLVNNLVNAIIKDGL